MKAKMIHPDLPRSPRRAAKLLAAATVALCLSTTALAKSSYFNAWKSLYPGSASGDNVVNGTGASCQLCHAGSSGGNGWNAYGWKVRENVSALGIAAALQAAEPFDSDLDPTGSSNLDEIAADAQPGWTSGPNNTFYFKDGSTQTGNSPPAILGDLDPSSGSTTTYCTAKVNSLGCTPSISLSSPPSASAGSGCTLSTSNVVGSKLGIYMHSTSGPLAAPFHGGFLCVNGPLKRHPPIGSGGSGGSCSGVLSEDLNAYIAAGADPALVAGATLWLQVWSRDPAAPFGDSLSDAVWATVIP